METTTTAVPILPTHSTSRPTLGLKERISNATTSEEIKELLAEGETYESSSPGTRRSWLLAAQKSRNRLPRKS